MHGRSLVLAIVAWPFNWPRLCQQNPHLIMCQKGHNNFYFLFSFVFFFNSQQLLNKRMRRKGVCTTKNCLILESVCLDYFIKSPSTTPRCDKGRAEQKSASSTVNLFVSEQCRVQRGQTKVLRDKYQRWPRADQTRPSQARPGQAAINAKGCRRLGRRLGCLDRLCLRCGNVQLIKDKN